MPDPIAMVIEHVRLNHRRVECGAGVPGCGPDCESGPDGKPAVFCPTCGPWPCAVSILLAEVDRLTAALKTARDGLASAESGWEGDPHGAAYAIRLGVEAALAPDDPLVQQALDRFTAQRAAT